MGQRSPKGEKTCYPPRSTILQNFSPIVQTVYEIYLTKVLSTFWPRGLTPVLKFTKRGDDLVDSEIYHPAKFHRPMSTRARDIHYHVIKVLRTKKKQKKQYPVTDISPACLLACGDKNYDTLMCTNCVTDND